MKFGITSILLALFGWCFVIGINYMLYEVVLQDLIDANNGTDMSSKLYVISPILKIIAVIIGILSLVLGLKAFKTHKVLAMIGILLSLTLIVLTFLPLWTYMLSASALDINMMYQ